MLAIEFGAPEASRLLRGQAADGREAPRLPSSSLSPATFTAAPRRRRGRGSLKTSQTGAAAPFPRGCCWLLGWHDLQPVRWIFQHLWADLAAEVGARSAHPEQFDPGMEKHLPVPDVSPSRRSHPRGSGANAQSANPFRPSTGTARQRRGAAVKVAVLNERDGKRTALPSKAACPLSRRHVASGAPNSMASKAPCPRGTNSAVPSPHPLRKSRPLI